MRALALLHGDPAHGWTIDELGRQAGLSRSALHERFVQLLGQPPMHYLASWRIQLGSRLLRDDRDNQRCAIASGRVYYNSDIDQAAAGTMAEILRR